MGQVVRAGVTLVEVLLAVALAALVFGTAIQFFRMGNLQVVKVSDHAQARMEAMKVLDALREDLDRVTVDDDIANLVIPLRLKDNGRTLQFFALHHRELNTSKKTMTLVAREMTWTSHKLTSPQTGAVVMRNGKKFGGEGLGSIGPVSDLVFEPLTRDQACSMQLSPYHAVWVKVFPRGALQIDNKAMASHPQVRLLHLTHIESQYACMLTIRNAGPPSGVFKNLEMLDDPFVTFNCPIKTIPNSLPLDWVRPLGLVKFDKGKPYDDKDEDKDEEH
ncbi:MAG: hypothetical protein HY814_14500 [Candidatus Riflebacteria bacterium]|nr:hypothetical protein [Candidatus Riflebacteria bacterium]